MAERKKVLQTSDLIDRLAKNRGIPIHEAQAMVDLTVGALRGILIEGQSIALRGFGNFDVRILPAEKKMNNLTHKEVELPVRVKVAFYPSDAITGEASDKVRKDLETAGA